MFPINDFLTVFFLFKHRDQILPCLKIGQGHSRVIIYINVVGIENILHAKFQDHRTFGSGEYFRRFLQCMGGEAILVMLPGPFILVPPSHGGFT